MQIHAGISVIPNNTFFHFAQLEQPHLMYLAEDSIQNEGKCGKFRVRLYCMCSG